MSRGTGALLEVARLLRDRELLALARSTEALAAAEAAVARVSADVEAQRASVRAAPELMILRPGALEAWLRHVRRDEARRMAALETERGNHADLRARAERAFGRVEALEALARQEARADRKRQAE